MVWKKRLRSSQYTFNSEKVFLVATQPSKSIYSYLQTTKLGLTQGEVQERQSIYGRNEVIHEQKKNPFILFIRTFINPFIGVLTGLAIISLLLDVLMAEPGEQEWTGVIIISSMVLFSAVLDNICYMGSNVISGAAKGIVFETGNKTYLGTIAKSLVGHRATTAFDKGISKVSFLLIRFMLVMVPFVFFVNGFTKGDWFEAFIFAISVAVGLTPEMLPMIVTANLSKGAITMSKKKTIVKNLNAIQNFGAMDILCTDKTGTLTCDKIVLEKYINADGSDDNSKRILRHAYFNSYFQTGLRNLMDKAILSHVRELNLEHLKDDYTKVDEIPFDFTRRRMSVVIEDRQGKRQIITKGAVEEILDVCSYAEFNGQIHPLTDALKIGGFPEKFHRKGLQFCYRG